MAKPVKIIAKILAHTLLMVAIWAAVCGLGTFIHWQNMFTENAIVMLRVCIVIGVGSGIATQLVRINRNE